VKICQLHPKDRTIRTIPYYAESSLRERRTGKVGDYRDEVELLKNRIAARADVVTGGKEAKATSEQLEDFINRWIERARRQPNLAYTAPYHPEKALLVDAADDKEDDFSVSALRSLRDVDQTSNLYLVRS